MATDQSTQPSWLESMWRAFCCLVLLGFIGICCLPAMSIRPRGPRGPSTSAEISQLEVAITAFKARYGVEPPSRIILHERPSLSPYNLEGDDVHSQIEQRTVEFFQKMWPKFPILTCQTDPTDPTLDWVDFNGDGKVDAELDLDGSECLLFFLGGIVIGNCPTGFFPDPINPFFRGGKRESPFIEFDISRIIDRDGDGMCEYVDLFPESKEPYVYFSSYDGSGYNQFHGTETFDNGTFVAYFRREAASDSKPSSGTTKWYKEKTFQLISAGRDGKLGTGGAVQGESRTAPTPEDADNLTNFTSGQLQPQ